MPPDAPSQTLGKLLGGDFAKVHLREVDGDMEGIGEFWLQELRPELLNRAARVKPVDQPSSQAREIEIQRNREEAWDVIFGEVL